MNSSPFHIFTQFHLSTCDFCLALCTSAPFLFLRPKQRENTLHSPDVKMFLSEKSANLGLRSNWATGIPIPSHWVVLVLALKPLYPGFLTWPASWLCSTWLSTYYYLGLQSPGWAKLKPNVTVYPILCLVKHFERKHPRQFDFGLKGCRYQLIGKILHVFTLCPHYTWQTGYGTCQKGWRMLPLLCLPLR